MGTFVPGVAVEQMLLHHCPTHEVEWSGPFTCWVGGCTAVPGRLDVLSIITCMEPTFTTELRERWLGVHQP